MSSALITLGNYPLALEHTFKALTWVEKHGSINAKTWANLGIALCYREQGDYNNSLVYCRKSLAMTDAIQSANFDHGFIWSVVGSVYEKNNQLDSAILYARKAYEIHNDLSGILYTLGSAYSKKNFAKAPRKVSALFFFLP